MENTQDLEKRFNNSELLAEIEQRDTLISTLAEQLAHAQEAAKSCQVQMAEALAAPNFPWRENYEVASRQRAELSVQLNEALQKNADWNKAVDSIHVLWKKECEQARQNAKRAESLQAQLTEAQETLRNIHDFMPQSMESWMTMLEAHKKEKREDLAALNKCRQTIHEQAQQLEAANEKIRDLEKNADTLRSLYSDSLSKGKKFKDELAETKKEIADLKKAAENSFQAHQSMLKNARANYEHGTVLLREIMSMREQLDYSIGENSRLRVLLDEQKEENTRLLKKLEWSNSLLVQQKEEHAALRKNIDKFLLGGGAGGGKTADIANSLGISLHQMAEGRKKLENLLKGDFVQDGSDGWPAHGATVRATDFGNIHPFIEMTAEYVAACPNDLILRGVDFDVVVPKTDIRRNLLASIDISGLVRHQKARQE